MTWRKWLPRAVLLTGGLLFADLFLGWHRATVTVAGLVEVSSDSSAWAGWGAVAGVLVLVLLVWEALRLGEVTACVLAVSTAVCTAIEFFSGTASARSEGIVAVDVSGRQWPAYVGLALAAALVVLTVAQLDLPDEQPASAGYGLQ